MTVTPPLTVRASTRSRSMPRPSSLTRITTAARSVPGVIVSDGAVVVPAGDVVPSTGQVIRTRLDLITAAP